MWASVAVLCQEITNSKPFLYSLLNVFISFPIVIVFLLEYNIRSLYFTIEQVFQTHEAILSDILSQ